MSTPQWDPFDEILSIREAMGRLIDDVFLRRPNAGHTTGWLPAVEMFDARDRVIVRFEVPGADPGALEVSVSPRRLTVRGRIIGAPVPGARYLARELPYGAFQRSMTLPPGLTAANATARFRHGVLEVSVRKAGRARAVPIEVED